MIMINFSGMIIVTKKGENYPNYHIKKGNELVIPYKKGNELVRLLKR